ncbi:kinase-like domain-containing protein [Pyrenochaeta sp. MPI-SDFR-AT-0127]|nr:kinase-like domain-containing protein [Pyrenochaeta sp. MPI-SDFR-AT-0127]
MIFGTIPKMFLPTYTWPHRTLRSAALATSLPPNPPLAHRSIRRLVGYLHSLLRSFSKYYCSWFGIAYDHWIVQLPFGLVLKWSEGTRLEEVTATMVARSAGFPVPFVISYGEHIGMSNTPVSILMTRLPGKTLGAVSEQLSNKERQTIFEEMQSILGAMRSWLRPWGTETICSIMGTAIRSVRVPNHSIGPCESESDFNKQLIAAASDHSFPSLDIFEQKLSCAQRIQSMQHPSVFTHGDLKHHNVMIYDGHVSGFIDWESAGWYPEYWEYTTALRFCPKNFWWYDFVSRLGGSQYMEEMESERALTSLTADSYSW